MRVRFYLDEPSGEPHVARHGVREEEVEQTLDDLLEDRPGRDGARVAIGRTGAGRYLRVIYLREDDGGVFVTTSFPLRARELWALRRRRRRKR